MYNLRMYGKEPYSVAVIHGGPGAPGGMAAVARELSPTCGVLEPLQTAGTIEGQIQELQEVLQKYGSLPVTLIGHSWGAWLSFIFTARFADYVKKLILVGSGPFKTEYATRIMDTRLRRLSENGQVKARSLMEALADPGIKDKATVFARFGELMAGTDSFDPLPNLREDGEFQAVIYQSVWQEAEELRESGALLKLGGRIRRPVVAIHGDYDPHPAEGVESPLSQVIRDFRFILLKKCGHEPWTERAARETFYEILKKELG